jgi:phosphohistidine phosphatase SixA/8-oxo-dGTP pyrophosphatase MutT (NUDIX family)
VNNEIIRAAGAVLWRRLSDELIQIALIHRPRYNDWSFPKGKAEEGELDIACAYREVLEETGYETIFGPELGEIRYEVDGATKKVKYWSAQAIGNPSNIMDSNEVDQLIWVTLDDAKNKLSMDSDKEILKNFESFGSDSFPLILLRHAKAVAREEWDSDDGDRPLAHTGQIQAKRFLPGFLPFAISEIYTSDAVRCYESIEPIARSLTINPIFSPTLSEYEFHKDKKAWSALIKEILENDSTALVCSHNPVIPEIVKKLIGKKNFKELNHELLPGEAWVLHHRDGEIIAIDWIPAPTA